MKRILAMVLALGMLWTAATGYADTTVSTDYRDYTSWPVVPEGEKIVIKVGMASNDAEAAKAEDTWLWPWLSEKTGLTFEYENVLASTLAERKTLMFAANDLPDFMWGFKFNASELVKYGAVENQLMDLTPYLTRENMPTLMDWFEAYPEARAACTAQNGAIYTLPYFYSMKRNIGGNERIFLNETWLDQVNMEKPKTLDEMNAFLYAVKEANPATTPLAGSSHSAADIRSYILNAFGYLLTQENDYGIGIALRDGEPVIPCADKTFYDFLSLMHQYYNDGIISRDYFLEDNITVDAIMTEGLGAIHVGTNMGSTYEEWLKWSAAYPLTSQWNDNAQWLQNDSIFIGGFAMSASCKYPAEVLKMVDFFYTALGNVYCWYGPMKGTEDANNDKQLYWWYDDQKTLHYPLTDDGTYSSQWQMLQHMSVPCGIVMGNASQALGREEDGLITRDAIAMAMSGMTDIKPVWDVEHSTDNYFRASMEKFVTPYEVSGYPSQVYFTPEVSLRINELYSVLAPYAETEVAKFITGARPLEEYDDFVAELEKLGVREYEQYYVDYYNR